MKSSIIPTNGENTEVQEYSDEKPLSVSFPSTSIAPTHPTLFITGFRALESTYSHPLWVPDGETEASMEP